MATTTTTMQVRRLSWLAPAGVLVGAGWGSNQFTPMLLVYHRALGAGASTLAMLFGIYALGLILGLVVAGPVSDARGRRGVVIGAAALSLSASVLLIAGSASVWALALGRLVAGLASGAAFGASTVWVRELSRATTPGVTAPTLARRTVIAMTTGFAAGPIVAGVLAQWAPASRVVPYLPHVAFMIVATALVIAMTSAHPQPRGRVRFRTGLPYGSGRGRWWRLVVPIAPWVFAAPAVAFGFLPTAIGADNAADGIVLAGAVTAVCALAGVLVQPSAAWLARRLGLRPGVIGLVVLAGGLVLGSAALKVGAVWMLFPAAVTLGIAYGLCIGDGLVEVQEIADPSSVGALTGTYYVVTYLGFAAPYLLTAFSSLAGFPVLLAVGAGLALATAVAVTRSSSSSIDERLLDGPPLP